ncbi:MAG TPA: hypothetical protein VK982_02225 [Bacteroidales bacterium]|nr:hypothetical protein [Bacteroidales bacterium]
MELEDYCKSNGIKYKHIAEKINVTESMFCHFRKGRKNLGKKKLELLKQIIKN